MSGTVGPIPYLDTSDQVADVPAWSRDLAEALRDHIQRFTVSVTVTNAAMGNVAVTFSPAFPAAPNVVAASLNNNYFASVANVTATGFSVWVRHGMNTVASATVSCHVIATDI